MAEAGRLLILLWIAVKLLQGGRSGRRSVKSGDNVWEAVRMVAIADIVMSLDNVLAIAAAAGGDTNLIIFGLVSAFRGGVRRAPPVMATRPRSSFGVGRGCISRLGGGRADCYRADPADVRRR